MWHDIKADELLHLIQFISENGKLKDGTLTLPVEARSKRTLEILLLIHKVRDGMVIVEGGHAFALLAGASGSARNLKASDRDITGMGPLEAVCALSGIVIMDRAMSRIGARMGRPEKSKLREMKPPVHVLFPVGEAGGTRRSLGDASSYRRT